MNYKKLDELNKLRLSGALTDEEFEREKQKMFDEDLPPTSEPAASSVHLPLGLRENAYLALMNFLILIPYVGWAVPLIMWIIGKDDSEEVRRQGIYIFNWYITWLLAAFCIGILSIVSIFATGFNPLLLAGNTLGVLIIVGIIGLLVLLFPIIGGIQGLDGKAWKYPLSIPLLKY